MKGNESGVRSKGLRTVDLDAKGYVIRICPEKLFSLQELIEIEHTLNNWMWDERIGPKPQGWDEMPRWISKRRKWFRPRNKYDISNPILKEIAEHIPRYYELRYHHEKTFGSTQEEFDQWWIREYLPRQIT